MRPRLGVKWTDKQKDRQTKVNLNARSMFLGGHKRSLDKYSLSVALKNSLYGKKIHATTKAKLHKVTLIHLLVVQEFDKGSHMATL